MSVCPRCGEENSERARFCQACAAPLAPATAPRDVRKTVTVVFADVTGSTNLGERLDPETLRRVMSRYFEAMRAAVQRHGGVVEKFIGDAVMAVFGIPRVHEDDALRAVRAAQDMRTELELLNKELERDHGVAISARIGVNTGEVVAGDASAGQRLVTGDAVNVAARLEQAAAPGEVLMGPDTQRLVRDAVTVDAVEPLTLKGKSEAMPAFRLVAVSATAPGHARRLDSPMVGRQRQRDLLRQAFRNAVDDPACHLFTVLGAAGVGKSRLVAEFLGEIANEARVLRGRCLSYGEGITLFPVREMVEQAAGLLPLDGPDASLARIGALLEGEGDEARVAERLGAVLGIVAGGGTQEETSWAVRKLLEAMGRREPIVAVIDDIHWAEPALLDLIEHVADWSRDSAILLLCPARPELLDIRPAWGGGKLNVTTISLEPLTPAESDELIENLLGRAPLGEEARARIAEAAEGNPLFVEETLSMLIDDGLLRRTGEGWTATGDLDGITVPPTINALLSARIDQLSDDERAAIDGAAVEGKSFHLGAVRELSSEERRPGIPSVLMSLVRKDLLRPDRPDFPGEEAFRFRHQLIRDAAYQAIPKDARAELHERFAAWLEGRAATRAGEYDDFIGYHLEQAYRYRVELGPPDDRALDIGRRASEHLASAGHRAAARSDFHAAANLFGRGIALLPPGHPDLGSLVPELAWTLIDAGELDRAMALVTESHGVGDDEGAAARRAMVRSQIHQLKAEVTSEEVAEEAGGLLETLERSGDDVWSIRASIMIARERFFAGSCAGSEDLLLGLDGWARRVGAAREENEIASSLISALYYGPTRVPEAIERIERIRDALGHPALDILAAQKLAALHAMQGRFDLSRELADRSDRAAREFGAWFLESSAGFFLPTEARLAGDVARAEGYLRESIAALERVGERAFLSTIAADLAQTLLDQERVEEAERYTELARGSSAEDDFASQGEWRVAQARILARRGENLEARRLADEGAAIWDRSDYLGYRGHIQMRVSEVRRLLGDPAGAAEAARAALGLYVAKGDVVSADRARSALADLGAG